MRDGQGPRHECWAFVRQVDWRAAVRASVAAGVAAGQRVLYVDDGSAEQRRAVVAQVPGSDRLVEDGTVRLAPVEEVHAGGGVVDPATEVATVAALTDEAVAAGYTGLRLVCGATGMVGAAARRDAWARYESLLDRYVRDARLWVTCGYDVGRLGHDAASELSCLHPLVHGEPPMFRLFAGEGSGCVLAGEVDVSCIEEFRAALRRAVPPVPDVLVDARGLAFIDHRGLLALEQHARDNGQRVVLHSRSWTVARVAELLELDTVGVQVAD